MIMVLASYAFEIPKVFSVQVMPLVVTIRSVFAHEGFVRYKDVRSSEIRLYKIKEDLNVFSGDPRKSPKMAAKTQVPPTKTHQGNFDFGVNLSNAFLTVPILYSV